MCQPGGNVRGGGVGDIQYEIVVKGFSNNISHDGCRKKIKKAHPGGKEQIGKGKRQVHNRYIKTRTWSNAKAIGEELSENIDFVQTNIYIFIYIDMYIGMCILNFTSR